jgi:putative membrane protein
MTTDPSLISILTEWTVDPSVVAGVVLAAVIYREGLVALRARGKLGQLVKPKHVASFAFGLITILLALESPIDALSDQLFSVHMVQHVLLLMIAPPLLLLGKPVPVLLVGLPHGLVRTVARAQHRSRLFHGLVRFLTAPVVTWTLFSGLTTVWHAPALYQEALLYPGVHLAEHFCFVISGLLFWWVALEPLPGGPRLGYAWRMLYTFAAMLPGMALGLVFVLSDSPVYPFYAQLPRLWGITEIDDQSAAGLVMWLLGDTILLAAAAWCFAKMMDGYEKRARAKDADLEVELQQALRTVQSMSTGGTTPL